MQTAIFNSKPIALVNKQTIDELKRRAQESELKRFRLCLHKEVDDRVQQMIVVLHSDTLFSPHKHPLGKTESIQIIEGELKSFVFDDNGGVTDEILLSANNPSGNLIYRLDGGRWHLPLNLTQWVVYHEIYTGPYDRIADVIYADWAPLADEKEKLRTYCQSLLNRNN